MGFSEAGKGPDLARRRCIYLTLKFDGSCGRLDACGGRKSELQFFDGLVRNFVRCAHDIDGQRVAGFFEVGELPCKNGFSSEVAVAGEDVLAHLLVSAAQIDNAEIEASGKRVTVTLLQSGAGEDGVLPFCRELHKARMNVVEPRRAIGVG